MKPETIIAFHDYGINWTGVTKAINQLINDKKIKPTQITNTIIVCEVTK